MRSRVYGCPFVCSSVRPIDRQQQQRAAGLLLSALWAVDTDRYFLLAPEHRSKVYGVMLRAEVRGSTETCLICGTVKLSTFATTKNYCFAVATFCSAFGVIIIIIYYARRQHTTHVGWREAVQQ